MADLLRAFIHCGARPRVTQDRYQPEMQSPSAGAIAADALPSGSVGGITGEPSSGHAMPAGSLPAVSGGCRTLLLRLGRLPLHSPAPPVPLTEDLFRGLDGGIRGLLDTKGTADLVHDILVGCRHAASDRLVA